MPLRVRASVCGRGERDRDILEAREAVELGRRQARQPVVAQIEDPVGNTPSKERARAHACQPMRVSTGPCAIGFRGRGSQRERTERGVCRKHTVTSRTCRTERGVCRKHTGTSREEPRHLRACVVARVSMSVRSLTCVRACENVRARRERSRHTRGS